MTCCNCMQMPAQTCGCTMRSRFRERRTVRWEAATWPGRHLHLGHGNENSRIEAHVVLGDTLHRDRSPRQAHGKKRATKCAGIDSEEVLLHHMLCIDFFQNYSSVHWFQDICCYVDFMVFLD